MKIWWIFLIVIFNVSFVNAELNWHYAKPATLAWTSDLKITLADGTTQIIPQAEISYKVFSVRSDNVNKINPILVKETNQNSYKLEEALEFLEEGSYFFGVQMIRNEPGKTEPAVSPIGWSSNPENIVDKQPFGVYVYSLPNMPSNTFVKTDLIPPAIPQDVIAE